MRESERSKLRYCMNTSVWFSARSSWLTTLVFQVTPTHPFKTISASMRPTKSCPPSNINRPLEIWWMVLWCLHPRQRTQPNGSYWEGHPWQADYPRPLRGGCRWRRGKALHLTSYNHLSDSRTGGLAEASFVERENAAGRFSFLGKFPH